MDESIGQRLRRLLDERHFGKSLRTVGREAGVDGGTVERTLRDETVPRYATSAKLAAYCQVSVEYLLTGEGSPTPAPIDIGDIRERAIAARQLLDDIIGDLDEL